MVRLSSLAPSDCSSQATCLVVAAFDMPSRRAAPVKLPSRATSTNTSMQRSRSTGRFPVVSRFEIETVSLAKSRLAGHYIRPKLVGVPADGNNSNAAGTNESTTGRKCVKQIGRIRGCETRFLARCAPQRWRVSCDERRGAIRGRQISGQADQDHRAVRAGRLDRYHRPRHRAEDDREMGPDRRGRDAAGRGNDDRHAGRGQGRSRRLYAAPHRQQSRHQSVAARQAAL